jgi:hypothetical protein
MAKKIYDIIPPEKKIFFQKKEEEKKKKFISLEFLFLFFLFFSLSLYFFVLKTAKVQVIIVPQFEEKKFSEPITIVWQEGLNDKNFIFGDFFEFEEVFSFNFPATGKTPTFAEGVIRLYNNYSTKKEEWKKGTRFVSSEGKVFLSKDKIVIPPAILEKGKLKPSFVDVPVIAKDPGEEGNIPPSKFSIPAFLGTERYLNYWGESLEKMKGGGESLSVTQDDLNQARETSRKKLEDTFLSYLKEKISEDYYFIDDGFEYKIFEEKADAKVGDLVPNFNYLLRVKIFALFPKFQEAVALAKEIFERNIEKNEMLLNRSLSFQIKVKEKDLEKDRISGNLEIKGLSFLRLDSERLKRALEHEKINRVFEIVNRYYPAKEIKVKKNYFFLTSFPDRGRIEVFLKVD